MGRSVIQGYFPRGLQKIAQLVQRAVPVVQRRAAGPAANGPCPACTAAQPRMQNGRALAPHVAVQLRAMQPHRGVQFQHNHPVTQPLAGRPQQPAPGANRGPVQRMANGTAVRMPDNLVLSRGAGHPLPHAVRQKMEAFFGTSFSDVRIHVGPEAAAIGALAFTQGSDIHFAPGQYNPASAQGQQILGHELAHVVQQRSGRVRNPFGSGVAVVQDAIMEAEADRLGHRAATHGGDRRR